MAILRLVHAGICAFFGYSAFIAFLVLKNYPSAVLGLVSGITDNILFFIHYLHHKGKLRQWYEPKDLRDICRYGMLVATAGLLCLGYFTTIQIMRQQPILPIPDSSVISIVWSIVALRSGMILMAYAIYYQKPTSESESRLVTESVEDPVEEGEEERAQSSIHSQEQRIEHEP